MAILPGSQREMKEFIDVRRTGGDLALPHGGVLVPAGKTEITARRLLALPGVQSSITGDNERSN
jgi:hypothetical protein